MMAAIRRLSWVLVVLAAIAVPGRASSAQPYELNAVLSLSGPGTFLGTAQQASLRALEETVNKRGGIRGTPIHFTFYDDQTNPQLAVQLTDAIIEGHVPVVIGSSLAASCRAMAAVTKDAIVQYCLSPVIEPEKGSYVFSAQMSGEDVIAAMVRYFRERGWKRLALLTTTDASGQLAEQQFGEALKLPENGGVTLVDAERFNPTDISVAAQLARMKAAGPQALALWAPGTPFGTALRGVASAGLDLPIMTTSANMSYTQIRQYDAFMPNDVYFQGLGYMGGAAGNAQAREAERVYLGAMKESGLTPDLQHGIAWDPAMIVIDALRKLGTGATARQLHEYLESLHDYGGICGVYDFRSGTQRGLGLKDTIVMRWDTAKKAWVASSRLGGWPVSER